VTRRLKGWFLSAFLAFGCLNAAEPGPDTDVASPETRSTAESFKNGDVVCFVGDSITRGGWFHSNVFLFYTTRFPQLKLRTFNCGRSGDRAAGALDRFSWDVLPHKPNVAVVVFGMNDVNVGGPQDEPLSQLEKLVTALHDSGCRVTQVTPTLYDESASLDAPLKPGKDASLATYSAGVRDMAARLEHGWVDVNGAMQRITDEKRKSDPTFTLIGPDRIHPGEVGHLVMAHTFLTAQGMPHDVARIVLDAKTASVVEQVNCEVGSIEAGDGDITFACTEYALPFVPTEAARPALELVPFMEDLNREMLVVRNLTKGSYELQIDDRPVGNFTGDQLAAGIDLAGNPETPQYRQSLEVTTANARRHEIESGPLRGVAYVRSMLLKAGIDPLDQAASERHLRELIEARKDRQNDFGKRMAEGYLGGWKDDVEKYRAEIDLLIESMRAKSQPVPRRWRVAKK
jgi:lysophospholipase L1-like esterase